MNSTDTRTKLSDFDYGLPKELIAQQALAKRSEARLMVLNRSDGGILHKTFRDVPDFFEEGDVLVLNDTKVIPARLFARRKTGGRVEILVLHEAVIASEAKQSKDRLLRRPDGLLAMTNNVCQVLIKPSGRVKKDEQLILHEDEQITLRVLDNPDHETGIRRVQFLTDEPISDLLDRIGRVPLPPYIDREDAEIDRELYQTVFARRPGAVASPTAGLHFDDELLGQIRKKGVRVVFVTLHVGYGTFQPVQDEDLTGHKMHEEYFVLPEETAEEINFAKADGRRVIGCGTTVVRTLESRACDSAPPEVRAGEGHTNLFIYPPYEFKIVDGMITNFHLPKTTLLMLASAFAGHEFLMRAYREAIEQKYRFYSYGDGMLIL